MTSYTPMASNIIFKSPISIPLASFQTSAQYIPHCSGFVHLVVPQMLLKLANSYDFVSPYPSPGSGLMPLFSEYNYWNLSVSVAYTFFFTVYLYLCLLASHTVSMFAIWVKFLPHPPLPQWLPHFMPSSWLNCIFVILPIEFFPVFILLPCIQCHPCCYKNYLPKALVLLCSPWNTFINFPLPIAIVFKTQVMNVMFHEKINQLPVASKNILNIFFI